MWYNEVSKGVSALRLTTRDVIAKVIAMSTILPRTCGVYRILCTVNNKIYIGSSVNMRVRQNTHINDLKKGVHRNKHLQNAWNKYGQGAFTFEVIEECVRGEQLAREQYYLDTIQPYKQTVGFNIGQKAEAAMLGQTLSPEARMKVSVKVRNYYSTPEGYAKKSASMMGHVVTPETREKLRVAHTGRIVSAATREKLGLASIGRKPSLETRAKMSVSQSGKKMSPEAIAKTVAGKEKHFIVTTPEGAEIHVKGLAKFCREHGLNRGNMMSVAVGKRTHHRGWSCHHA